MLKNISVKKIVLKIQKNCGQNTKKWCSKILVLKIQENCVKNISVKNTRKLC